MTAVQKLRFVLGVVAAPLAPGLLFGLPDELFAPSPVGVVWSLKFAAIAEYPPIIFVGVPLYWFAFRKRPATFWRCMLIGFLLGAIAYLRAHVGVSTDGRLVTWDAMTLTIALLPVSMFCGGIAALCFWLIARPDKLRSARVS